MIVDWGGFGQFIASALGGATILGASKFWYDYRREQTLRSERQRFLAVQIVYQLEDYAMVCVDALTTHDLWEGSGGNAGSMISGVPDLPDRPPSDHYSLLDLQLVERLYTLPQQVRAAKGYVSFDYEVNADPEPDGEVAEDKTYLMADLAAKLARDFRLRYGMTKQRLGFGSWDVMAYIAKGARHAEDKRSSRE
ncbi:hypothetical protein [Ferrovibrio xuzhouensis]|uniref:Uncharacterized protein n=1 Tax=Ferrovibrio xuzhouensis TaxID=1576914 RepID=A0ABV7VFK5_9PROT